MTQDEIQKAFPEARQITGPEFGQMLGVRNVKIGTANYSIRFRFGSGSEGLSEVLLSPEGEPEIYAELAQSELLSKLTDKYGAPTKSSEEDVSEEGKIRRWEWIFPETDVTLSFSGYTKRKNNFTVLTYHKRQKSDLL